MPRLRVLIYNGTFFLACLLAFLLVFESYVELPAWLQVGGRMHPLFLHFPIVLLVIYGLWVVVFPRSGKQEIPQWANDALLAGAFSAVVTSLMGFLLSQETDYQADAIFWHKWTGIATAYVSFGLYSFRDKLPPNLLPAKLVSAATVVTLLAAGHLGGSITHGDSYLVAPILPDEVTPQVPLDEALVFAHVVQPILEEKCVSCHNTQKAKGELVMTTAELLAKGGKNGTPWDTTQADLGLMIRRAHLPLDDKKHMPPRGKVQLTDDEIQVLESWIRGGSSFTARVVDFPRENPLFLFASNKLGGQKEEQYDFPAASESSIQELNTNYRVITPLAMGSPALAVNFYNASAFSGKELEELSAIKEQIVELDASTMPVRDQDLKTIASFRNLRKLLLNFTDITGENLSQLTKLTHLRELSLTGTKVKLADIQKLREATSLKTIYLANTGISEEGFVTLRKEFGKVAIESGFQADNVILKLNPPQIENKETILTGKGTIYLKHQIKGAVIRYTTDGTDPDSINSPIYKDGIKIDDNVQVKARAYKPGWYGSDITKRAFYRMAFRADSVALLTTPSEQYPGNKGKVLIDGVKSDGDFRNGKWLGYKVVPLTAVISMQKPVTSKKITLSMLQNVSSYIFPPVRVEVWGGTEINNLKLLSTLKPSMPTPDGRQNDNLMYECSFSPQPLKYVKVVAVPLAKLPGWHQGKGEPAWVFMDEVFIN